MPKEAQARILINKLLEQAGWRLLDTNGQRANVLLENFTHITTTEIDAWGNDYEKVKGGAIDFLLVDDDGKPICVLEAKKESIHPLAAKEQARKYAKSVGARYIILSNGIVHFLWDTTQGNPNPIYQFPSASELSAITAWEPDRQALIDEVVDNDYIVQVQMPDYRTHPGWKQTITASKDFIFRNGLRFLRNYQIKAIQAIQNAASKGKDRFLFEMATGTGKTLTSAAVIRLFLRTGNAKRVLFLVDRLELEDQAWKNFVAYLSPDYKTIIYKENRDYWRKAEVVVTTIQSLMSNDRYRHQFKPTDFDLIISDESHRSISGNARAVFEYFHGYKLGLTATPKDYLKGVDIEETNANDPREIERRMLRDTYITFGCDDGNPTYRYSLLDGVKDGFLVNPTVLDARTEITTQLLSKKGYAVQVTKPEGDETKVFVSRDFEKKFFSKKTNYAFCKAFIENALYDPISGEMGKTICFCVSQNHATKITQILNEYAEKTWPGKYQSDFAIQVTSTIPDAQQYTINFSNNNLLGKSNWLEEYTSSKARICVTVGMMTTGYDCPDLLNLCMMRPIFSPADFVQVKGRGTRKHTFEYKQRLDNGEENITQREKEKFKLFDFFANCEYFEKEFNYDEKLHLPKPTGKGPGGDGPQPTDKYETFILDPISFVNETPVGLEGMRIDRELFKRFEDRITTDDVIKKHVELQNWEFLESYVQNEILDKPNEYFTLDKLRLAARVDRKLTVREVIEKIFGIIPDFKPKDALLDEEFDKFVSLYPPEENVNVRALKYFFKAYIVDQDVRRIIESKSFQELHTNPTLTLQDFTAVDARFRNLIPEYVRDYVPMDKFAA